MVFLWFSWGFFDIPTTIDELFEGAPVAGGSDRSKGTSTLWRCHGDRYHQKIVDFIGDVHRMYMDITRPIHEHMKEC